MVCVLFVFLALIYLAFPRLLRRRMNNMLAQLHFWASLIGFLLVLALPIVLNLTFQPLTGESTADRFFRAFGVAMTSTAWAYGVLLAAQGFLLANLVWSIFKGERIPRRV